jgi:hypothetical protein
MVLQVTLEIDLSIFYHQNLHWKCISYKHQKKLQEFYFTLEMHVYVF